MSTASPCPSPQSLVRSYSEPTSPSDFSSFSHALDDAESSLRMHHVLTDNEEGRATIQLEHYEDGNHEEEEENNIIQQPYIGMEFFTEDEAYVYYNTYAKQRGFGIRKSHVDRSKKNKEMIIRRLFVCNKQGYKDVYDKRRMGKSVVRRADTRVNCMARMVICRRENTWIVKQFNDDHSKHNLSSPDKVFNHRSHRQLHRTPVIQDLMGALKGKGLQSSIISKVVNAVTGSQSENVTPQQCHDHLRKLKKNNIGREAITIIKHFQSKQTSDPDFYFAMQLDDDLTFRSVFWVDGRSRASYMKFGDVLVFDVTYRTNNLKLPFAPFTGVNHHRQSILFGCALLADEREETFIWLFKE